MAIRRLGGADEEYVARRTLVANAIVASLMPKSAVKGGSAMKIRYGNAGTRASTDLDAARSLGLQEFIRDFQDALAEGWCGFEGRIAARNPAHPRNVPKDYVMQPFDVKLSYLGSPWCTVSLELGHNEIGDADEPDLVEPADANRILGQLNFPQLEPIPTMALHHQIAQKLHGASEPGSRRAHDLIDLQIIVAHSQLDYALVRKTCERLFAYRQKQAWPPTIVKNEEWEQLYLSQFRPSPVLQTIDEAIDWANELVKVIVSA